MTNINLYCKTCGARAKRPLLDQVGCRGVRETACAPVHCPDGHGLMEREDGFVQQLLDDQWVVTGRR